MVCDSLTAAPHPYDRFMRRPCRGLIYVECGSQTAAFHNVSIRRWIWARYGRPARLTRLTHLDPQLFTLMHRTDQLVGARIPIALDKPLAGYDAEWADRDFGAIVILNDESVIITQIDHNGRGKIFTSSPAARRAAVPEESRTPVVAAGWQWIAKGIHQRRQ